MSNYKIRVNSEAESKEAQELFFELGYEKGACSTGGYPALIIATPESRFQKTPYSSRATSLNHEAHSQYKEITLPELRDMVVLKRNDVGDATHYTKGSLGSCLFKNYVGEKTYAWHKKLWQEQPTAPYLLHPISDLKPIEKPMKEYLRKNSNGTYSYIGTVRLEHVSGSMIEIPEGATAARLCDDVEFYKNDFGVFFSRTSGNWLNTISLRGVLMKNIVWQRHTQPEELPFIDDEPLQSLNDQYAEIEKVRQDIINSPSHYADSTIECIDAMEAMMTHEQFIGYLRGNVFKYQWRYEKKNGIEDLKKAQWYLERLTEKVAEKNAPF